MTAEQKGSLAAVITVDREIMHGTPCFSGARIPVRTLIDFLESGDGIVTIDQGFEFEHNLKKLTFSIVIRSHPDQ